MEEWMRDALERHLIQLSNTIPITDVLISLRVANIFDQNDYELIMNDSTNQTDALKRIQIVGKLKTRDSRAYWLFCHYIRQRCPQIFDKLHTNTDSACPMCNGQEDAERCNYCTGKNGFILCLSLNNQVRNSFQSFFFFGIQKKQTEDDQDILFVLF